MRTRPLVSCKETTNVKKRKKIVTIKRVMVPHEKVTGKFHHSLSHLSNSSRSDRARYFTSCNRKINGNFV